MAKPENPQTSTENIKIAFFLNLAFTLLEIVGGILTNSLAILSDALHDLGDSFSLGLSWYLDKFSLRDRDERFTYGYRRFSLLAALINTIVLIIGSIFIISEAIPRLINPEHSHAPGMVGFAIAGILVNGLAVLRLRGGKTMNIRVVTLHLLEDVLGWTAVLIVGIVLLFKDIHILDPLLSIMITGYVLFNVIRNLKKTLSLFLQGVPENITMSNIENQILEIPKVHSTHHMHVWSLDGVHHVLSTHVVISQDASKQDVIEIKKRIRNITDNLNMEHSTVEFEYQDEDCRMDQQKERI